MKRIQTYYDSSAKRIQKYIVIKFTRPTDRPPGALGEIIIIGLTLHFSCYLLSRACDTFELGPRLPVGSTQESYNIPHFVQLGQRV